MAKSAKAVEVEVTDRVAKKIVAGILERYSNMESARGSYMNRARREREGIQSEIDGAAARGIPPKITKLVIKVVQTQNKLTALLAELDSEERKVAKKFFGALGDKKQLVLFTDLPEASKPAKDEVVVVEAAKPRAASSRKKNGGATGKDIDDAEKAANVVPLQTDIEDEHPPLH